MSDPSVGENTKIAKVAAIIFSVVVLGAFAVILPKIISAVESEKVALVEGSVVETLVEGDPCVWSVTFELEMANRPEAHVWVLGADVDGPAGAQGLPSNDVSGRMWYPFVGELTYELFSCPDSIEDIAHRDLKIEYRRNNQTEVRSTSLSF